jgi:hypothetical protein
MFITEEKFTSIRVRQGTAERLSEIGRKGESYDQVIVWLLDHCKKRKAGYSLKLEKR